MVARSTNEAIDVGKIAAAFGGGGHSRAAAALSAKVRSPACSNRSSTRCKVAIRPNVTVSQIMSYGAPQTLSPDDTIAAAVRAHAALRFRRLSRVGRTGASSAC
jgi:tRNA nucleotidyltransferase (CCA-adding enzyme)